MTNFKKLPKFNKLKIYRKDIFKVLQENIRRRYLYSPRIYYSVSLDKYEKKKQNRTFRNNILQIHNIKKNISVRNNKYKNIEQWRKSKIVLKVTSKKFLGILNNKLRYIKKQNYKKKKIKANKINHTFLIKN